MGAKIKQYRKRSKLTQQQLADLIGKTESSIRKYEKGLVQVPNYVLHNIADALNISFFDLMDMRELKDRNKTNDAFKEYLESIGYSVSYEAEVLEWHYEDVVENGKLIGRTQIADKETFNVKITYGEVTVVFTEYEFDIFKNSIRKSIEFEVFKAKK